MLPAEDRRALKKEGNKIFGNGVISPLAHPLQTHNRKSSSSEAQLYRQGERDSSNNPRPIQSKPPSTTTRQYGSADAAERWSKGAILQPKPPTKPPSTTTRQHGSADAAERWSRGAILQSKPPTKPPSTTTRQHGSADAAERWSNSAKNRGSYTINSGDTLSAIAKRELGSSSRWREIKKADGSAFTESEAGRLQIGQQVHLPGTSGSSNNSSGQPSNLRGMSADAAESWSNSANSRKQIPNLHGMSADAAEHWSLGSTPKPQLAITPRREQNNNNGLNQTSNVVIGTAVGAAVGAFVAERKLLHPVTIAPDIPENPSRAPYNGYGYHTGQIAPNPGKRLTFHQRQNVWRAMADDPKAPLTEVQRQQIRATLRHKSSAPTWKNPVTGKTERMELSHEPKPHRQGGQVVVPRWPEDHAARDPHRHLSRYVRDAYENQGDAIRRKFAEEVVVKEWGYKVNPSVLRGEKPPTAQQVSQASRVVNTLENAHLQKTANTTLRAAGAVGESRVASVALRGVSRVAAPIGVGLDAWRLGSAYKKDGFGQEFRETAGSVAGGWGGAAAGAAGGAAIGSIVPGVGTAAGAIVGGIIGGVAGSEFGDDIEQGAEKAGQEIAGGAKKAWNELFG